MKFALILFALIVSQVSFAETTDNAINCKSKDGKTSLKIALNQDKTASVVEFKNRGKTLITNLNAKATDGLTQLVVSGAGFTFVGDQGFATAQVAYLKDGGDILKADILCKYPQVADGLVSDLPENSL